MGKRRRRRKPEHNTKQLFVALLAEFSGHSSATIQTVWDELAAGCPELKLMESQQLSEVDYYDWLAAERHNPNGICKELGAILAAAVPPPQRQPCPTYQFDHGDGDPTLTAFERTLAGQDGPLHKAIAEQVLDDIAAGDYICHVCKNHAATNAVQYQLSSQESKGRRLADRPATFHGILVTVVQPVRPILTRSAVRGVA